MCDYRGCKLNAYFKDKKFVSILDSLSDSGILTVGDYLDHESEIDLSLIRGVGTGKITKFKERLTDVMEGRYIVNNNKNYDVFKDFKVNKNDIIAVASEFRNINILVLDDLLSEFSTDYNISVIGDLESFTYEGLAKTLMSYKSYGISKVEQLLNKLEVMRGSLDDLINQDFTFFKTSNKYDVLMLRVEGKTLGDISKIAGVTIERIRQICKKSFSKLGLILYGLINKSIELGRISTNRRNNLCDLNNITELEDLNKILVYFIKSNLAENMTYLENLDLILVNCNLYNLEDSILSFVENKSEIIENTMIYSALELLYDEYKLNYINYNDIAKLLVNKGYNQYNRYFSKSKISYETMVEICIEKYYPNGFNLSRNLESLKGYISKEFTEGLLDDKDESHFIAYIDRSKNIIKAGIHLKIHINNLVLNQDVVNKVADDVIEILESNENKYCDIVLLYDLLTKEHPNYIYYIPNKYILHGILTHYYGDRFNFKKMNVSLLPLTRSRHDTILSYINSNSEGSLLLLSDVSEALNISQANVVTEIYKGTDIVLLSNHKYVATKEWLSKYSHITSDVRACIVGFLSLYGYCNSMMVYSELKDSLLNLNITNSDELFYVMRALFSEEFRFLRKPHIIANCEDNILISFNLNNVHNLFRFVPRDILCDKVSTRYFLKNTFKLGKGLLYSAMGSYSTFMASYFS